MVLADCLLAGAYGLPPGASIPSSSLAFLIRKDFKRGGLVLTLRSDRASWYAFSRAVLPMK